MQASEMRNPQAYFNLGFMHQFGLGLPQDFHLAKRFYDMTMQVPRPPVLCLSSTLARGRCY
jgi:SEL1 protein